MSIYLYTGLALILTAALLWCVNLLFREVREYRETVKKLSGAALSESGQALIASAERRESKKGDRYGKQHQ